MSGGLPGVEASHGIPAALINLRPNAAQIAGSERAHGRCPSRAHVSLRVFMQLLYLRAPVGLCLDFTLNTLYLYLCIFLWDSRSLYSVWAFFFFFFEFVLNLELLRNTQSLPATLNSSLFIDLPPHHNPPAHPPHQHYTTLPIDQPLITSPLIHFLH